jgi:cytochrome c
MRRFLAIVLGATVAAGAHAATPSGDAARGMRLFRACAACHSVIPGHNMTGPSLAGIWGRKAGSLESFGRYSPALKEAGVVWNAATLDAWLKSPAQFIPGNGMKFAGIADEQQRAELIGFLKEATAGQGPAAAAAERMTPRFADLKKLGPDHQAREIRYCRGSYHVVTSDGRNRDFWEANLRFKTDSSGTGPLPGTPVIMPAGMMGDRASVFFAAPEEIGTFIKHQC